MHVSVSWLTWSFNPSMSSRYQSNLCVSRYQVQTNLRSKYMYLGRSIEITLILRDFSCAFLQNKIAKFQVLDFEYQCKTSVKAKQFDFSAVAFL